MQFNKHVRLVNQTCHGSWELLLPGRFLLAAELVLCEQGDPENDLSVVNNNILINVERFF